MQTKKETSILVFQFSDFNGKMHVLRETLAIPVYYKQLSLFCTTISMMLGG